MSQEFSLIACDASNIDRLPCCGIRNPDHAGRQAKCSWLRDNLQLGARAKILTDSGGKPCGYIEYMPGERCWRGDEAAGYMVIQCIWNQSKAHQRKGWASAMLADCLADAKRAGMHGVVAIAREGPWLADRRLYIANGFERVDFAPPDFEMFVCKFDAGAPNPSFRSHRARYGKGLTIIQSAQCPYAVKFAGEIARAAREEYGIEPRIVELRTWRDAQNAPTPYAVFALLYNGRVVADHQVSRTRFRNIMRAEGLSARS